VSSRMSAEGRTIVILGTARGVGKTLVARGILERIRSLGHRSIGIVPIETGCSYGENHDLIGTDGASLRASSSGPVPPLVTSPYRFAAEASPAEAAARAGLELTLDDLESVIEAASDFGTMVVVEGPHHAMAPLVEGKLTIDLASHLEAPALIVGRAGDEITGALVEGACRARNIRVVERLLLPELGERPLEAVKVHLESHRIVETLIEALRAP
jgi:dethiobiotin synthetase